MSPLRLSGVRKEYGPVVALDGVDLAVERGRLHLLAGPNGSGKSTALRLLLGLAGPTDGTVDRDGASVDAGFQRPAFYPDLSVRENLDVFCELSGASAEWRDEVVDRLDLDRVESRRAGALSGGYAKKLDLSLAIAGRPDYLLLDEPLGDLDDRTRESVVDLLAAYRDDGNGVLVSSHRVEAFDCVADRMTVLDRGTVRFDAGGDALGSAVEEADSLAALYRRALDGET